MEARTPYWMRSEKWGRIILRSLKGQLQDERSLADMDRVADRFAHSKAWDQADFNDELFFPFTSWVHWTSCFQENYGFLSL